MTIPLTILDEPTYPQDTPMVHLTDLDTVWFQVAGTICNLRCHHCFISCTPENDKFKFLSLEKCRSYLEESLAMGVREYYFTGGEPFANPDMCDILDLVLTKYGPATVLTNATLLRKATLNRLQQIDEASIYSLEIRVSLDGYNANMNDPIRGEGTFDRAMAGIQALVEHGFLPTLTITRTWCGDDDEILASFVALLKSIGYDRPRLKILPLLKLGAEQDRSGGYGKESLLTSEMMAGYDQGKLVCSSARLVTSQGVWVCPILLDEATARVSETLADSTDDYPLAHHACYTCWQYGAICSNVSTASTATTDA